MSMKVSEYLDAFRTDDSEWAQNMQNIRLREKLQSVAKPGKDYFLRAFEHYSGGGGIGHYHPDTVEQFCIELGLETMKDFENWMTSHSTEEELFLFSYLSPDNGPFDWESDLQYDLNNEIISIVAQSGFRLTDDLKSGRQHHFGDGIYAPLPSLDAVYNLIEANWSDTLEYTTDKRDCEDFCRYFRGRLSARGLGNLCAGLCEYNYYDEEGSVLGAHAVMAFIVRKGEKEHQLWLADPQNDMYLWTVDKGTPVEFHDQDYIELRKIFW